MGECAMIRMKILLILGVCLNIIAGSTSNATGNTPQGQYTSIKALDKFGNSVQLRNAKLASKHSSLVLAAKVSPSGSILVCSVQNSSPGLKQSPPGKGRGSVIHVIGTDEDVAINDPGRTVALVCSGVNADAGLLRSLLREQSRRVWERYGTTMTVGRLADSISEVLLTFMGYDRAREISDGTGPVLVDKEFKMARPFGVDSLALGVEGTSGSVGKPSIASIIHIDAAGVQRVCNTKALGKGSAAAQKLLQERWTPDMKLNEVKELCSEIMKEVLFGKSKNNDSTDEESTTLILYDLMDVDGVQSTLESMVARL